MKAVTQSRYGNPEVLRVTTLERPVPRQAIEMLLLQNASQEHFARQSRLHLGATAYEPSLARRADAKLLFDLTF